MRGEEASHTIAVVLLAGLPVLGGAFLVSGGRAPPYYFLAAISATVLAGLLLGFARGRLKPDSHSDVALLASGGICMFITAPLLIAGGVVFAAASVLHAAGLLAASAGMGMAYANRFGRRPAR